MSEHLPINENHTQTSLYKRGLKGISRKVRKENPGMSRRASGEIARAIAEENKPNTVRRQGVKRIAKQAAVLALSGTAAIGFYDMNKDTNNRMLDTAQTELTADTDETEVIVVKPGDTLYEIASQHTQGDPRALLHELAKQPDVQDGVHPGDHLIVPTVVDNK